MNAGLRAENADRVRGPRLTKALLSFHYVRHSVNTLLHLAAGDPIRFLNSLALCAGSAPDNVFLRAEAASRRQIC